MVLAADISALSQELDEIGMLSAQAVTETERHESRRAKAEERVAAMEIDPRTDPTELREARAQLLVLSRRAVLFEAQQQVLEGKARTLARFKDRMVAIDEQLSGADQGPIRAIPATSSAPAGAALVTTAATSTEGSDRELGVLLRAQEELRRDIARHMHDGPAQSLANIALQAEIVQRLASRGDARVAGELGSLRTMVQAALETTKEFIFEVRPMVLDDLGLVPTLRRVVVDRGRRAGVEVSFDSQGPVRRLDQDMESGLYRIVAEATTGYVSLRPGQLQVRLDWSERDLYITIRGLWAIEQGGGLPRPGEPLPDDVPPALRAMIEQNMSVGQQARAAAHSLPAELLTEITDRARSMGVTLEVRDDGATLEVTAAVA
jgi:two-component system sensor histidine kinase DegS